MAQNPIDAIVIGAGLSGLTTAAWLAREGKRVVVFDQHYLAGGNGSAFPRKTQAGKFMFDVGLHYIGGCEDPNSPIPFVLNKLGADVEFRALDPDGFEVMVFPDFTFRYPAGIDRFRERLVEQFPSEKRGIDRYLKFIRQLIDIQQRLGGRMSFRKVIGMLWNDPMVVRYKGATAAQLLNSCTKDPKLQAVLLGQNGTYGLPPSRASAIIAGGLTAHYIDGAYYPKGGGDAIAKALVKIIEEEGGEIRLKTEIKGILVQDGRAVGVRWANRKGEMGELSSNVVVSSADISRTFLELIGADHLEPKLIERARNFEWPAGLAVTYLGIEGDLKSMGFGESNYFQFDGYDFEEGYRLGQKSAEADIQGAYITSATIKDPGNPELAPEGFHTVEVMAVAPGDPKVWGVDPDEVDNHGYKDNPRYLELKQGIENKLVAKFLKLFPDARDHIHFRETATPLTISRYTRANMGSGYGIASSPEQMLQSRPSHKGPIPGLYLCGHSTRSGHGVAGVMWGGRSTARRILREWLS